MRGRGTSTPTAYPLDYTLAWGPLILGNAHPAVIEAVTAQLARGFAFGAQHRGEIELAELMTGVVPGLERVIFSNTGSEAVQAALRLARVFTGRPLFVKFEGHYHGWFNNVLVSYKPKHGDPIAPLPTCGGQPAEEFADTLVVPWNDLAALERAFADHPDRSPPCSPSRSWPIAAAARRSRASSPASSTAAGGTAPCRSSTR